MKKFPIELHGTRQLPAKLVWAMWADYNKPMSLSAVERKHGRRRGAIRTIFVRRGLAVRQVCKRPAYDPLTGRIIKLPPATEAQIAAMIEKLDHIRVPDELKREWRKWSWPQRGAFLARLRQKFKTAHDRPETPFSDNVEPFDYCSPRAHEIERAANAGRGSTHKYRVKIKLTTCGVIYRGKLYYWGGKERCAFGYISANDGPYVRGIGRPLLHHVIWQDHHGRKVPPQTTVIFKDGNKNNHDPDNLELKHRETCLRENQAKALKRKAHARMSVLLKNNQAKETHANSNITLSKTLIQRLGRKTLSQSV